MIENLKPVLNYLIVLFLKFPSLDIFQEFCVDRFFSRWYEWVEF